MEFLNLKNLERDNNGELYDLTIKSFEYKPDVLRQNYNVYVVDKVDEMRIDNICFNIYGSTDYVDFLCDLNNIKNPLMITEGMEIIYVPENAIPAFRPERSDNIKIRESISNKRKATKVDPKRKKFLEEKSQSLPPSITKKDYNPIKYKDGKISIGDNIFKV